MEQVRAKLLQTMLKNVIFEGWSAQNFDQSCKEAEIDKNLAILAFPRGAIDVIAYMHRTIDEEFFEALTFEIAGETSRTQRIAKALKLRFKMSAPYKEEIKSAASLMSFPQNNAVGTELIWQTVSQIWKAIGDEAQGWEYYSKRASLFSVYSASFLYWLQDQEDGIDGFIDRRLQDIGRFARLKSRLKTPFTRPYSTQKPKFSDQ